LIKAKQDLITDIRRSMHKGEGSIEFEHIATTEELKGKCRLFAKLRLEPNASIGLHEHNDEEEIFYILKGTGLVTDDNAEKLVHPGDVVITRGGSSHSIKNNGTSDLELIAVILIY